MASRKDVTADAVPTAVIRDIENALHDGTWNVFLASHDDGESASLKRSDYEICIAPDSINYMLVNDKQGAEKIVVEMNNKEKKKFLIYILEKTKIQRDVNGNADLEKSACDFQRCVINLPSTFSSQKGFPYKVDVVNDDKGKQRYDIVHLTAKGK